MLSLKRQKMLGFEAVSMKKKTGVYLKTKSMVKLLYHSMDEIEEFGKILNIIKV